MLSRSKHSIYKIADFDLEDSESEEEEDEVDGESVEASPTPPVARRARAAKGVDHSRSAARSRPAPVADVDAAEPPKKRGRETSAKADEPSKDEVEDALTQELKSFLVDHKGDDSDLRTALLRSKLDEIKRRVGDAGAGPAAGTSPAPGLSGASPASRPEGGLASVLAGRATKKQGTTPDQSASPAAGSLPSTLERELGQTLLKLLSERKRKNKDEDGSDSDEERGPSGGSSDKRLYFKKLSKRSPGLITERELGTMLSLFEPGRECTRSSEPTCVSFLLRSFLPQHPVKGIGQQRYREVRTICEATDKILRGDLAGATDTLIARFKSIQRTIQDGHDRIGRWFEILPGRDDGTSISLSDEAVATGIESQEARRAKLLREGAVH